MRQHIRQHTQHTGQDGRIARFISVFGCFTHSLPGGLSELFSLFRRLIHRFSASPILRGSVVFMFVAFLLLAPGITATNETILNNTSTNESTTVLLEDLPVGYVLLDEDTNITNVTELLNTSTVGNDVGSGVVGEIVNVLDNDTNTSGFYVRLDDPAPVPELIVEFGDIVQERVRARQPVILTQQLTITNEGGADQYIINLWEYATELEELHLTKVEEITISLAGEVVSNQQIFSVDLATDETVELLITYVHKPVVATEDCTDVYLFELLPSGAIFEERDLPLSTLLGTKCTVHATSDAAFTYVDVEIPLSNIIVSDEQTIQSSSPIVITGDTIVLGGVDS